MKYLTGKFKSLIHRIPAEVVALVIVFGVVVFAEDISLTTYYPSPRGSYNQLRTVGNTLLAQSNNTYTQHGTSPLPVGGIARARVYISGDEANNTRLRFFQETGDIDNAASIDFTTVGLINGPTPDFRIRYDDTNIPTGLPVPDQFSWGRLIFSSPLEKSSIPPESENSFVIDRRGFIGFGTALGAHSDFNNVDERATISIKGDGARIRFNSFAANLDEQNAIDFTESGLDDRTHMRLYYDASNLGASSNRLVFSAPYPESTNPTPALAGQWDNILVIDSGSGGLGSPGAIGIGTEIHPLGNELGVGGDKLVIMNSTPLDTNDVRNGIFIDADTTGIDVRSRGQNGGVNDDSPTILAENLGRGIAVEAISSRGHAVSGKATVNTGNGIYGEHTADNSVAMKAVNEGAGTPIGILTEALFGNGIGVVADAAQIGVWATSRNDNGIGLQIDALGDNSIGIDLDATGSNSTGLDIRVSGATSIGINMIAPGLTAFVSTGGNVEIHDGPGLGNLCVGVCPVPLFHPASSARIQGDLIVDGDILVGGTIFGGDLAESMRCPECDLRDVVTIDPDNDRSLIPSTVAYDYAIAGVVSEDPSFTLGKRTDETQPIALAGVVRVKATTENGPIKRGDLLVSSSTAGHAMRGDIDLIKPGMTIGKAFEPLSDDSGSIYILITGN